MIAFKLKCQTLGGHTHVRVFAGSVPDGCNPDDYTLGCCGDLTFRNEEWDAVREALTDVPGVAFEAHPA